MAPIPSLGFACPDRGSPAKIALLALGVRSPEARQFCAYRGKTSRKCIYRRHVGFHPLSATCVSRLWESSDVALRSFELGTKSGFDESSLDRTRRVSYRGTFAFRFTSATIKTFAYRCYGIVPIIIFEPLAKNEWTSKLEPERRKTFRRTRLIQGSRLSDRLSRAAEICKMPDTFIVLPLTADRIVRRGD
jgi:hypothetical protein